MLKEFKDFIMRGNVLELAVAVIIAGAFGGVVASFTNDVIMPPIGLALGGVDFSDLAITLAGAEMNDAGEVVKEAVQIRYGAFVQKVIDFVIIAFCSDSLWRLCPESNRFRDHCLCHLHAGAYLQ